MKNLSNLSLFDAPLPARRFDLATVLGISAAFGLVFLAIALGEGGMAFLDLKSFLIVLGGTLGATLVNYPLADFKKALPLIKRAFFPEESSEEERINSILSMAKKARAGGALALEDDMFHQSDPFVRKCLELLVDNVPAHDIRRIMEIELSFLVERHRRGSQIFQSMGTVAPAMGLIGTLIGLVQMLRALENPAHIGPAMSIALLTTFYGAMLAHLVFLPLSGKLRARSEEEILLKEMTLEGILEIANGTNPRIIEQRLFGFLPPQQRFSQYGS